MRGCCKRVPPAKQACTTGKLPLSYFRLSSTPRGSCPCSTARGWVGGWVGRSVGGWVSGWVGIVGGRYIQATQTNVSDAASLTGGRRRLPLKQVSIYPVSGSNMRSVRVCTSSKAGGACQVRIGWVLRKKSMVARNNCIL